MIAGSAKRVARKCSVCQFALNRLKFVISSQQPNSYMCNRSRSTDSCRDNHLHIANSTLIPWLVNPQVQSRSGLDQTCSRLSRIARAEKRAGRIGASWACCEDTNTDTINTQLSVVNELSTQSPVKMFDHKAVATVWICCESQITYASIMTISVVTRNLEQCPKILKRGGGG